MLTIILFKGMFCKQFSHQLNLVPDKNIIILIKISLILKMTECNLYCLIFLKYYKHIFYLHVLNFQNGLYDILIIFRPLLVKAM